MDNIKTNGVKITQQDEQNSTNQQVTGDLDQNIPSNSTKIRSFLKGRLVKLFLVSIISSLAVIFLTLPVIKVISIIIYLLIPIFFPGVAESLAFIPSIILIFITILLLIKVIFKDKEYIIIGLFVMILTVVSMLLVSNYRITKFYGGMTKVVNEATNIAEKTQITITGFEENPTFNNSQILTGISFKVNFISNSTADIRMATNVRFKGQHIAGNEFLFWYDPTEVIFNNETLPIGSKPFYHIEANKPYEITFLYHDLSEKQEYMSNQFGHFEIGVGFGVYKNLPEGYGGGNAGTIYNIIDKTGKSIKEDFAYEEFHYNSNIYKLKGP